MAERLLLLVAVIAIGILFMEAAMRLWSRAQQLDDEDHEAKLRATRDLREARDDFRYGQDVAARQKKGKKK